MDDHPRRSPVPTFLTVLVLVGGAYYFFTHYEIRGLSGVSVESKNATASVNQSSIGSVNVSSPGETMFVSTNAGSPTTTASGNQSLGPASPSNSQAVERNDSVLGNLLGVTNQAGSGSGGALSGDDAHRFPVPRRIKNVRVGSWALSGFGPSKMASDVARRNIVRVARQFDILALQQISSRERDIVPRLVDEMNEDGRHFDFVLGEQSSDLQNPEHLAVIFDVDRVRVDRTATYTIADPTNALMYDPLVTWFRVAEPAQSNAWTFTLVNVHVELTRAKAEVAVLPTVFASVRNDGRGEDDVVMAGLFQADDRYLIPSIMGQEMVAAVRSMPTDIFGRHQTSNVIVQRGQTSEFLGRGGVVNILRQYNLSKSEAESVSPHLPIFADFTPVEGGKL